PVFPPVLLMPMSARAPTLRGLFSYLLGLLKAVPSDFQIRQFSLLTIIFTPTSVSPWTPACERVHRASSINGGMIVVIRKGISRLVLTAALGLSCAGVATAEDE